MVLINVTYIMLIVTLGIRTSISDYKHGIIQNALLLRFAITACCLDFVTYAIIARDLLSMFLINVALMSIVSIVLFYTHSYAGGDCKLTIVMAMLYPAEYLWRINENSWTLVIAIMLAVLVGFIYLTARSIYLIISKKISITSAYIKGYLAQFGKSYLTTMIYLSLASILLFAIQSKYGALNVWFCRTVYIALALMVGKSKLLKKWFCIGSTFMIALVASLYLMIIPFSLNVENYVFVTILLALQMIIKSDLYEAVKVENLKRGMILSKYASIIMQTSGIKGLPGVSTESLKDRITDEQIKSIQYWAKRNKISQITIVKKMPFAIFIFSGFLIYLLIGVCLHE